MTESEYITYPLKVQRVLWGKFKDVIPRSKNLNAAVIELIEEKIKKTK